ncbi:hypothetical protein [Solibacillus sp. CAU 1738]|uniref:hypothetical protein n=1 Tax=Solibacillus sp. CAU 1738 TaxID=3140363 RepID=UPI0032610850
MQAIKTFSGNVELKGKVAPTITAVELTATNQLTLTFSENVVETSVGGNYELFFGDSKTALTITEGTIANNKLVITLPDALTSKLKVNIEMIAVLIRPLY